MFIHRLGHHAGLFDVAPGWHQTQRINRLRYGAVYYNLLLAEPVAINDAEPLTQLWLERVNRYPSCYWPWAMDILANNDGARVQRRDVFLLLSVNVQPIRRSGRTRCEQTSRCINV